MLGRLRAWLAWPVWPVVLGVVVADVFVAALAGISLRASYQHHFERAAVTSHNVNQLVSQSIGSEIDRIDMGLAVVQDEYLRQRGDALRIREFLTRQRGRLPMSDGMRIADARGNVIYSSDTVLKPGLSVTDRDYFAALRADAAAGLVISAPVASRISGRWVLVFARRLHDRDGRFGGIVFAPVLLDWFNQKFTTLSVGPRGVVVLRGDASRGFDMLARFPAGGLVVGQDAVSSRFRAMMAANPQGGTYEATAAADNVTRIFSYRPVGRYPLMTLVGLSTEDTLAEWQREAAKFALLAAAFVAASALGGYLLLRALRARIAAYDEVRALNDELESDIAARRRAEGEVTRLNDQLEQRVRERTQELLAANRELEAFSYSVSHDLRTPLRAIDGFAHILTEDYGDRLDAQGRSHLERIRRSAVRMGDLIDDILDFSRAARQEMDRVLLDIKLMAREAFDEACAAAPGRNIVLRLDNLPPVHGDRAMMRQVLLNLMTNAVKFTASRPQAIIEVMGTRAEGENVYSVRDNGVGFDMQYADKLFGVFQRLHGPGDAPGTGIGLAIVKRVVERHGGRVWAEGRVGEGATVYFSLPVAD